MKKIYIVTVDGVEYQFDSVSESGEFANANGVWLVETRKVEA